MILFEQYRAALLLLHTFSAFATLALTTHLVFWLWSFFRGQCKRPESTVRFSAFAACSYALTMLLGLALYPTYKVRVRAQYLQQPTAIAQALDIQMESKKEATQRNLESRQYRNAPIHIDLEKDQTPLEQEKISTLNKKSFAHKAENLSERFVQLTKWFDIKEHWTALGFLLSLACAAILWGAKPSIETKPIAMVVFFLALGSAATSWSAAIIGLLVTAARSVSAF